MPRYMACIRETNNFVQNPDLARPGIADDPNDVFFLSRRALDLLIDQVCEEDDLFPEDFAIFKEVE